MKEAIDETGPTLDATATPDRITSVSEIGNSIGNYTVLEELGAGGMGVVVAAHDPDLDRKVAIKVLRSRGDASLDEARNQRFLREAQALARLAHPNVVAVFQVGVDENRPFIVMERVDGDDLAAWLRSERPGWQAIVDAYVQAAQGVAACHGVGLIHRDVKPSNILIDLQGRARISDFGLVCAARDQPDTETAGVDGAGDNAALEPGGPLEQTLTNDGAVLGTPAYAAPEQLRGETIDHRADQFSLCVSLYEGVYGARPGSNRGGKPAKDSDSAPEQLRTVLERGMSMEPEARYSDMPALIAALQQLSERPARRRWPLLLLATAGVAAVAIYLTRGPSGGSDGTSARAAAPAAARAAAAEATPSPVRPDPDPTIKLIEDLETEAGVAIEGKRPKEATAKLEKALGLAANRDPLLLARLQTTYAWALSDAGKVAEARAQVVKAIANYERSPRKAPILHSAAYDQLGTMGIEAGDGKGAAVHLQKAIDLFLSGGGRDMDTLAVLHDNLAVALTEIDNDRALKHFRRAMQIRKDAKLPLVGSYGHLAMFYRIVGNKKEAKRYRNMARKSRPSSK